MYQKFYDLKIGDLMMSDKFKNVSCRNLCDFYTNRPIFIEFDQ